METKSNPNLKNIEKQFSLTASNADDKMLFHTDHTTQMDWLLEIAEEDEDVVITNREIKEIDGKKYIVGLSADVPVGYLTLKSKKRSNNNLSSTVSKPSSVKDADFDWAKS